MDNEKSIKAMHKVSSAALSVCFVATALIIALIAQFSSLAWFSSNERVSAEGMRVEVLYTDICETINYYRGTETALEIVGEDRYNRYYFSYDPAALTFKVGNATTPERDSFATPIPMLEYSDLSGSCQILIEIKLKNPGTYKIGISTETEEYLGNMLLEAIAAFETEGAEKIMISPTGLPLSSVVHFAILDSAANDAAGVQDDTEKKMLSLSDKEIAPIDETFVHFTETDQGITSSYATPFHDHADNKQTVEVGEDGLIYVYVDYYLTAVEDIIEKTLLYVDGALENDPTYNDIIIGLTNLMFSTDFTFTIEEASES